jgi:hypothetical protein
LLHKTEVIKSAGEMKVNKKMSEERERQHFECVKNEIRNWRKVFDDDAPTLPKRAYKAIRKSSSSSKTVNVKTIDIQCRMTF